MIREAEFKDFPRLFAISRRAHQNSVYRNFRPCIATCTQMFRVFISNENGKIWVYELDGKIEGFLVGLVAPFFFSDRMVATDQLFLVTDKGKLGGVRLLKTFEAWARSHPKVSAILHMIGYGMKNWEKTASLYRKTGMDKIGEIYLKELAS